MEDNESSLIQCPKCGNIQGTLGKCLKCGLDLTFFSAGEKDIPAEDTRGNTASSAPEAEDVRTVGKFRLVKENPQSPKAPPTEAEPERPSPDQPVAAPEDPGPAERALVPIFMPVGRLITLSLITFGIYQIFWFYRNWKILKYYHDRYVQPVKLTLMMLIPFYGIYLAYKQLKGIDEMTTLRVKGFPLLPVFIGWILVGSSSVFIRPEAGFLLSSLCLGSVFLLAPVQWSLNKFARSSGHTEPSPGSRKGWMTGALVLTSLILAAGIWESVKSYLVMEPFRAETAALDAVSASTGEQTKELLVRYGSYIERSKSLINAKGLMKRDRQAVFHETSRLIDDLPRKLHCVTRGEAAGIQYGMVKFINEGNTLKPKILADMSVDLAEVLAKMKADLPGAANKGLDGCASEPFDLKAFVEEMRLAKAGTTGQQAQGEASSGPAAAATEKPNPGGRSRIEFFDPAQSAEAKPLRQTSGQNPGATP